VGPIVHLWDPEAAPLQSSPPGFSITTFYSVNIVTSGLRTGLLVFHKLWKPQAPLLDAKGRAGKRERVMPQVLATGS
jgi:hypothetical protein